jgi:hypothetical protein
LAEGFCESQSKVFEVLRILKAQDRNEPTSGSFGFIGAETFRPMSDETFEEGPGDRGACVIDPF